MKGKVADLLKENHSAIAFTTDGLSSSAEDSYHGITAHSTDNDWKMQGKAKLLAFYRLVRSIQEKPSLTNFKKA